MPRLVIVHPVPTRLNSWNKRIGKVIQETVSYFQDKNYEISIIPTITQFQNHLEIIDYSQEDSVQVATVGIKEDKLKGMCKDIIEEYLKDCGTEIEIKKEWIVVDKIQKDEFLGHMMLLINKHATRETGKITSKAKSPKDISAEQWRTLFDEVIANLTKGEMESIEKIDGEVREITIMENKKAVRKTMAFMNMPSTALIGKLNKENDDWILVMGISIADCVRRLCNGLKSKTYLLLDGVDLFEKKEFTKSEWKEYKDVEEIAKHNELNLRDLGEVRNSRNKLDFLISNYVSQETHSLVERTTQKNRVSLYQGDAICSLLDKVSKE